MAIEFPSDLIQQLQISLRKEAGIPCYNPEDVSLSDLPSLREAIEGLDPSPPYLRCKQCHGKLLRGIQSIVCVYCGAQQQNKDIPPDPINFKSTFGYPWLLQSLNLNGSEPVEAKDSNKGQNSSKDSMSLSDLLNIEIKWSAAPEKNENDIAKRVPNLNKNSLNVAGVDLDNFFSETMKDSVPYASEQHDTLERAAEHTTEDSSGWEAEFQPATAGTLPVDLIPLDLFPDASPIDLSSTSEAPFRSKGEIKFQYGGVGSDLKEKKPVESQASMSDNWFQDDQWHTSNVESSTIIAQTETKTGTIIDGKSNNLSSMDDTLFPDDIWLTSSEKLRENDESVDAWQDFTSSGNVPDPFPSVSSVDSNTKTSANRLAPEMNLLNGSSNDQDMDFGSFMAPEIFSGTTSLHNGPTTLNNMQQGSYADRLEVKPGEHKSEGTFDGAMWSESADNKVERLMSEMHDLSFMLDSHLSIPQKKDAV